MEAIENLFTYFMKSSGVSTDTRNIKPGEIFFAMKGPNFNGNEYAEQALEKGARLAVIDDTLYKKNDEYFVVDDALQAMQLLARRYRRYLNIPVVGLTGSNGKTTTKELIHRVLSLKYNVFSTQGNLNNHIGVPLTLLNMPPDTEMAVIEMGANKVGDIEELVHICEPSHGLITNIGKAHLEGFGSYEGVIRGKSELYQFLIAHNKVIFVNRNEPALLNMSKRMENPYFYPGPEDFLPLTLIEEHPYVKYQDETGETIATNLIGKYNFNNIASALCVGKFFDIPLNEANKVIAAYNPENQRSQIIKKPDYTIILDAYNANPVSVKEALTYLDALTGSKVAILGDMKELGEYSYDEHYEIGKLLIELSFKHALLCGDEMSAAADAYPDSLHFTSTDKLLDYFNDHPIECDYILIKGSRSMQLEKLVDKL